MPSTCVAGAPVPRPIGAPSPPPIRTIAMSTNPPFDEPASLDDLSTPEIGDDLRWMPKLSMACVGALGDVEGDAPNACAIVTLNEDAAVVNAFGFRAARHRLHRDPARALRSLMGRLAPVLAEHREIRTVGLCVRRGDGAVGRADEVRLGRRLASMLAAFEVDLVEYIVVEPVHGPDSLLDAIDPLGITRLVRGPQDE